MPVLAPAKASLLLCLVPVLSFVAEAGSPYRFDVWTAEDGLPQNVIRGICQTGDGYLWLATLNGAVRFDGVRFTVFDRSNSHGIRSNRFTSIYLDRKGDLWFGTENSGVTRYHGGDFRTYTTEQGLPDNITTGITGDDAGHIWVSTPKSMARWQEGSGLFSSFAPDRTETAYRPFLWEGDGLWALGSQRLHCFLRGRLVTYALPSSLPQSSIWNVAQDRAGTIWLETLDGKQFRMAGDHLQTEWSACDRKEDAASDQQQEGLGQFTLGRHLHRTIICSSPAYREIFFTHLFEDRERNLWLGTDGQGLYQLRRQFITTYGRLQGLVDSDVYPIFQDHTGAVWIGAWQSGLSRFQNGKFTNYTSRDGLPTNLVTALTEDGERRVWVAAATGVATFWEGRFHKPPGLNFTSPGTLQAMQQDQQGTFWFGTSVGLLRYQNGATKLFTARDGVAGNDIHVLVESGKGDFWIGGSGGVTRMRHGQFTRWTENEGLPPGVVRSIYIDRDGVVWIGTYEGGLGRLEGNKITRYTTSEGLFDNGVFQILEDERGYFWMSCNRGIYRVGKRDLNEVASGLRSTVVSVHYGRADGMNNVECNGGLWPAGIKARDGMLWFPTQDGVAVIDPALAPVNRQPPPVAIESFLLDGAARTLKRGLEVTPKEENFEVRYTALSFVHSSQIQFKYKLEGLEPAWVDAGTRRAAYYSHVPPGSYLFRVIARNSDGVWNLRGASLPIRVLAPFYRTGWFELLLFCAAVASVRTGWRYRVSQLEREQEAQRAFSNRLMAAQESERKRIAGELHDSVGQRLVVVKNLAVSSLRAQEKSGANERKNSLREISEEVALAIEETRQISYNLRPFQLDRLGLTKAIESMARTVSRASGVPISAHLDNIDDVFSEEVRINFFRIVQECLSNMMKYAHASEASIRIQRSEDCVLLTVRDDGRGFTLDGRQADAVRSGFGLAGMAERARLLGGELTVHSERGAGTKIVVSIRCGENKLGW